MTFLGPCKWNLFAKKLGEYWACFIGGSMVEHHAQESLRQLYLSLVRPHLEYASQVWDPHLSKDRSTLEKVQKFACKLATSKWNSRYEELLSLMDIKPLQNRRLELKLGLMFKLVNNLCFTIMW